MDFVSDSLYNTTLLIFLSVRNFRSDTILDNTGKTESGSCVADLLDILTTASPMSGFLVTFCEPMG